MPLPATLPFCSSVIVRPAPIVLTPPAVKTVPPREATVICAVAVLPVPPFVELTLPVVFVLVPDDVAVTVMSEMQLEFAAIVALVREITSDATLSVPLHLLVELFGAVNPLGRLSLRVTPVNAVEGFGFVTVIRKTEVPPTAMGEVRKVLLIVGALVNSSAPMSGGLLRVSLSKSFVIPDIVIPALPAGEVLPTC